MKVQLVQSMKILFLNKNNFHVNFCAGKSFLYTDFDGTLLAESLNDIYTCDTARRNASIYNFNKYFAEIQDFIDKSKGKFEIIITTGRRLCGDKKEGFEPTYEKMKEEGIKLPEIKAIITTSGGDIYHFKADGTIEKTPDKDKAALVKNICGWDSDKIKAALDKAADETKTEYKFTDIRGNYKLSILIADTSKIDDFYSKLTGILENEMSIKSKIGDVKIYDGNESFIKARGIKLEPKIEGHSLHKDFDVKIALKEAVKNNDFVITAGDADNDREMLNIFRYINQPKGYKAPKYLEDITDDYVKLTRDEIEKLPLKILFIKPNSDNKSPEIVSLHEFMKKTEELFPKKVNIIEQTQTGGENHFLNAVKSSVEEYAKENKNFSKALKGRVKCAKPLILSAILAFCAGSVLYLYKKNTLAKQKPVRQSPLSQNLNNMPEVFRNFKSTEKIQSIG